MGAETCPLCGSNLQGEEIPELYRSVYGETHYSRVIGVEVRGVYDGVLFWACPDCGKAWPRFEQPDSRSARAAEEVAAWNAATQTPGGGGSLDPTPVTGPPHEED